MAYKSLVELLKNSANRWGDQIALVHKDSEINYNELVDFSLKFATRLREAGLKEGDHVVVLLENSIEYVVSMVAVFFLGGVVVPLNPELPSQKIKKIFNSCNPKICLLRKKIKNNIENLNENTPLLLLFDSDFNDFKREINNNERLDSVITDIAENEIAMILFTSGTTGDQKGVILSHGNVISNIYSIVEYLSLKSTDSTVSVLPFYFSYGNSILMTHLSVGGKVVIENNFVFPNKVVDSLKKFKPSGFYGVPSTYYILLNRSKFENCDLSFLRYICQAGGGMRRETISKLKEILPDTDIFIMYGQTEGTARLSYLAPELLEVKSGSIGRGIPGVQLNVVDSQGKKVDPDTVGEIVAKGNNVMMGYLNDPVSTRKVLKDGWLYTGDLGTVDDEGFIYLVSRKKDIIKIAGYRIGPVEIEEVIAQVPGVEDVAVIGIEDHLLGEAVVAFVVFRQGAAEESPLREHCKKNLPYYMLPKRIISVPDIPRTGSGKTRYNILRTLFNDSYADG